MEKAVDKEKAVFDAGASVLTLATIMFVGHIITQTAQAEEQLDDKKKTSEVNYKTNLNHFKLFWIITRKLAAIIGNCDELPYSATEEKLETIKNKATEHLDGVGGYEHLDSKVYPDSFESDESAEEEDDDEVEDKRSDEGSDDEDDDQGKHSHSED